MIVIHKSFLDPAFRNYSVVCVRLMRQRLAPSSENFDSISLSSGLRVEVSSDNFLIISAFPQAANPSLRYFKYLIGFNSPLVSSALDTSKSSVIFLNTLITFTDKGKTTTFCNIIGIKTLDRFRVNTPKAIHIASEENKLILCRDFTFSREAAASERPLSIKSIDLTYATSGVNPDDSSVNISSPCHWFITSRIFI